MSVKNATLGGTTIAAGATLPFTGFPIWMVALVGLGVLLLGVGARRKFRADEA